MRKRVLVVVAVVLGLVFCGYAMAAQDAGKGKPQTICPVEGGKINKSVYTDYEGKRIYFCCSHCIDEFKKDPQKYLKKMEDEGVVPEKTPGS